jgi:hypothetical protein
VPHLDCDPDDAQARYDAFDELADLVNSGQLSLLGAKALWYEFACPVPQDALIEPPEIDI